MNSYIGLTALSFVALCGLLGCSTQILDGTSGTESTGSSGTGGSSGEGGSGGMCESGGGPIDCSPYSLGVEIAHNGELVAKGGDDTNVNFTVQGALRVKGPGSFEIDACANADCKMPDVYQVTLYTADV